MRLSALRPYLILFIFVLPMLGLAQPGDPGGDPDVPITGLEFLVGGGVLFGLKRILDQIKSNRKQ